MASSISRSNRCWTSSLSRDWRHARELPRQTASGRTLVPPPATLHRIPRNGRRGSGRRPQPCPPPIRKPARSARTRDCGASPSLRENGAARSGHPPTRPTASRGERSMSHPSRASRGRTISPRRLATASGRVRCVDASCRCLARSSIRSDRSKRGPRSSDGCSTVIPVCLKFMTSGRGGLPTDSVVTRAGRASATRRWIASAPDAEGRNARAAPGVGWRDSPVTVLRDSPVTDYGILPL